MHYSPVKMKDINKYTINFNFYLYLERNNKARQQHEKTCFKWQVTIVNKTNSIY